MSTKEARPDHPVQDVIRKRWSPYVFSERPVSKDDLRSLFEAARWAPSAFNEQPWSWIVATKDEPAEYERVLSCLLDGNQEWARVAPVLALSVVRERFAYNDKPNPVALHDIGLAAGNLMSEATVRGIYVHQMSGILPDRARELFDLPEHSRAATAIAIGYRGDPATASEKYRERDTTEKPRRPLDEIVFAGGYGRAAPWVRS